MLKKKYFTVSQKAKEGANFGKNLIYLFFINLLINNI